MPAIEPQDRSPMEAAPQAAALVPSVCYSTAGLPADQQFDAWRAHCLPVVEVTPAPGRRDGYLAAAEVWTVGRFALSRVVAEAAGYRRTAAMIRRDGLDHWVVNVALSGSHRFRSGGREALLEARVPHLFSLARSFEGEREDIEWIALFVPRDAMPERVGPLDPDASGPIEGALGALLGRTLERIVESLPRMTAGDVPKLEAAIAGLLAGCLVLPRVPEPPGNAAIEAARRARALAIIRRELGSPGLGPAEICKLAAMSRSQLYRCFVPLGGVARAIQAERLTRAHASLLAAGANADIGRTGESLGFPDASTFSRAFRRHFGYTPSQLVAPSPEAGAPAPPAPGAWGLAAALDPRGARAARQIGLRRR